MDESDDPVEQAVTAASLLDTIVFLCAKACELAMARVCAGRARQCAT